MRPLIRLAPKRGAKICWPQRSSNWNSRRNLPRVPVFGNVSVMISRGDRPAYGVRSNAGVVGKGSVGKGSVGNGNVGKGSVGKGSGIEGPVRG